MWPWSLGQYLLLQRQTFPRALAQLRNHKKLIFCVSHGFGVSCYAAIHNWNIFSFILNTAPPPPLILSAILNFYSSINVLFSPFLPPSSLHPQKHTHISLRLFICYSLHFVLFSFFTCLTDLILPVLAHTSCSERPQSLPMLAHSAPCILVISWLSPTPDRKLTEGRKSILFTSPATVLSSVPGTWLAFTERFWNSDLYWMIRCS